MPEPDHVTALSDAQADLELITQQAESLMERVEELLRVLVGDWDI